MEPEGLGCEPLRPPNFLQFPLGSNYELKLEGWAGCR